MECCQLSVLCLLHCSLCFWISDLQTSYASENPFHIELSWTSWWTTGDFETRPGTSSQLWCDTNQRGSEDSRSFTVQLGRERNPVHNIPPVTLVISIAGQQERKVDLATSQFCSPRMPKVWRGTTQNLGWPDRTLHLNKCQQQQSQARFLGPGVPKQRDNS